MAARLVSAVGFYGPKRGPLRDLLAGVQAMITSHIGDSFLPYTLDQVHATLISLDGVRDTETGTVVNGYYLEHTGTRREMDLRQVADILTGRFQDPLRVRIGGFGRRQQVGHAEIRLRRIGHQHKRIVGLAQEPGILAV